MASDENNEREVTAKGLEIDKIVNNKYRFCIDSAFCFGRKMSRYV